MTLEPPLHYTAQSKMAPVKMSGVQASDSLDSFVGVDTGKQFTGPTRLQEEEEEALDVLFCAFLSFFVLFLKKPKLTKRPSRQGNSDGVGTLEQK